MASHIWPAKKRSETLHIPEARFIEGDGTVRLVQPVSAGERVRPGRVAYDPEKHRMKLMCPYCDVRVDFNKGSGAACGAQVDGARAHFKKARGQEHAADCDLPHVLGDSDSIVDKHAPYRVHLNMNLGGRYNVMRPIYERMPNGKVVAHDGRLQPEMRLINDHGLPREVKVYKEAVSIREVKDLHDLMRRGEGERLRGSLVVHNAVTPWTDFAVLNKKRLKALMDRLLNGASHPVMLHVCMEQKPQHHVEGAKVFYKRDERGAHFIVPRVFLDGPETRQAFDKPGNYLVVGIPRVQFNERSGAFFLNMSVKSPAQVMAFSPSELVEEARARAAKRQGQSTATTGPAL